MTAEYVSRLLMPEAKAAEYIGVAQPTLHKWRHAGKAPAHYLFPGRVMYTAADIDAWMAERRREMNQPSSDVEDVAA